MIAAVRSLVGLLQVLLEPATGRHDTARLAVIGMCMAALGSDVSVLPFLFGGIAAMHIVAEVRGALVRRRIRREVAELHRMVHGHG